MGPLVCSKMANPDRDGRLHVKLNSESESDTWETPVGISGLTIATNG